MLRLMVMKKAPTAHNNCENTKIKAFLGKKQKTLSGMEDNRRIELGLST